jgi:hypothetical protein
MPVVFPFLPFFPFALLSSGMFFSSLCPRCRESTNLKPTIRGNQ